MSRDFVILDRDGTVMVERKYLASADGVELLPNAGAGLCALRQMGFGLILVTNQAGVGRGYFTMDAVAQVQRRLTELLDQEGVSIDGVYVCPHSPEARCRCRKPNPGLVELASTELNFDPATAIVIGDKPCDVELGERIGALTVLVKTGYGALYPKDGIRPQIIANDLKEAATLVAQWREISVGVPHDLSQA